MGTINKTVVSVFEGKYISKTITACATLETYGETPIFISVKITKEVIESVARTFWGSSSPGVTDYEALQVWIMKFWKYSTILRTSVEIFVDWLANGSPPWAAYCAFISGGMIAIDKQLASGWRRRNVAASFCQDRT